MPRMKILCPLAVLLLLTAKLHGESREDPEVPSKANPKELRAAGFTALFDGTTLNGWRKAGGTGKYKVEEDEAIVEEDRAIVGYGKNIRGNTFLCSKKTYGDFILVFQKRPTRLSVRSCYQLRIYHADENSQLPIR